MKTVKQLYATDMTKTTKINNVTGYNRHTVNQCKKSNN